MPYRSRSRLTPAQQRTLLTMYGFPSGRSRGRSAQCLLDKGLLDLCGGFQKTTAGARRVHRILASSLVNERFAVRRLRLQAIVRDVAPDVLTWRASEVRYYEKLFRWHVKGCYAPSAGRVLFNLPFGMCPRCDGTGKISSDSIGLAWRYWEMLASPHNKNVRLGLVLPLPCPACDATGARSGVA